VTKFVSESEKLALDALDQTIFAALVCDNIGRAPVGRALEKMPEHVQKNLKLLRSKYLRKFRPDAVP